MSYNLDPKVLGILQCPYCKGKLNQDSDDGLLCRHDDVVFRWTGTGSLDMRPKKPLSVDISFEVTPTNNLSEILWHDNVVPNPMSEVNFGNIPAPHHLSRELMSHFPKAKKDDELVLDLGCGDTVHRNVCEMAGFTYVGVDFDNRKAPILADAHVLPFCDDSFDFLISINLLEHIQYPFVMIREAHRVLRPNGVFIGTVAFLEPFHGNSYYHHSRLGTLNTLRYGGFDILQLATSTRWSVFTAQAAMSANILFPKVPRFLSRNLISMPHRLSNLWWKLARFIKSDIPRRPLDHTVGAFSFVVKKPRID
jgi:ubiquinone/menaquinone biosynthesis C-methylase UbiE